MAKKFKSYERYLFSTKKEANKFAKNVLMKQHMFIKRKKEMCYSAYKTKKTKWGHEIQLKGTGKC